MLYRLNLGFLNALYLGVLPQKRVTLASPAARVEQLGAFAGRRLRHCSWGPFQILITSFDLLHLVDDVDQSGIPGRERIYLHTLIEFLGLLEV